MGVENPNLGEEEVVGVEDGTRYIAAFVLQHATFPTPPLVSPKFLRVPPGVGG